MARLAILASNYSSPYGQPRQQQRGRRQRSHHHPMQPCTDRCLSYAPGLRRPPCVHHHCCCCCLPRLLLPLLHLDGLNGAPRRSAGGSKAGEAGGDCGDCGGVSGPVADQGEAPAAS